MNIRQGGLFALLALSSGACGKSCSCSKSSPAAGGADLSDAATMSMQPEVRGIEVAGNVGEVVAAVHKVTAECAGSWKAETGFDLQCPAFVAWNQLQLDPGRADWTFVNLLEDDNERVRALGARGLANANTSYSNDGAQRERAIAAAKVAEAAALANKAAASKPADPDDDDPPPAPKPVVNPVYETDKAMAERIVAAAEHEKSEAFAGILGFVVAGIDVGATGFGERIKALALAPKGTHDALQTGIAANLLRNNRESDLAFEVTRTMAEKGATARTREEAMTALALAADKHGDEVCKVWFSAVTGPDDIFAASVATRLTGGMAWATFTANGWSMSSAYAVLPSWCSAEVDPTLELVEKRAKAGQITDANWVIALKGVGREGAKTTGVQKNRAVAIARAIAEGTGNASAVRAAALRFVAGRDAAGKGFAAKFVKDGDGFVQGAAVEILSGKKP